MRTYACIDCYAKADKVLTLLSTTRDDAGLREALSAWQEFIGLMRYDADCKMNIGTAEQYSKAVKLTEASLSAPPADASKKVQPGLSREDKLSVLIESIIATLGKYGRPYAAFRADIEKRFDAINQTPEPAAPKRWRCQTCGEYIEILKTITGPDGRSWHEDADGSWCGPVVEEEP